MADVIGYAISGLVKYTSRTIDVGIRGPIGFVSDAFNAHSDFPTYSRRLEIELPLRLQCRTLAEFDEFTGKSEEGCVQYSTFESAKGPLKDLISAATGKQFSGDVTTDGSIAIHPEHYGPNWLQEWQGVGPGYIELHFRDADTLTSFIESAGVKVDYGRNTLALDGNNLTTEGRAERTVFDFFGR